MPSPRCTPNYDPLEASCLRLFWYTVQRESKIEKEHNMIRGIVTNPVLSTQHVPLWIRTHEFVHARDSNYVFVQIATYDLSFTSVPHEFYIATTSTKAPVSRAYLYFHGRTWWEEKRPWRRRTGQWWILQDS